MKCRKSTKPTHRAPKNDPKTTPRRPKKRSRTTRRKKDRTKTILGPSWTPPGTISTAQPCFGVPCWRPKRHQNRSENDQKSKRKFKTNKTDPRRSWTRLGAILGRLGCHLGPTWTSKSCSRPRWRSFFRKITFSMLRRFEDGFGTNFGRPRRQNDRK